MLEHIAGISRAVEGIGAVSAVNIGSAQEGLGISQELVY